MSLDFSFHRRKRGFPYSLFGFAAVIASVVLSYLYFKDGGTFSGIASFGFSENVMKYLGFSIIVIGFLSFMLSLGTIATIKADFKIFLYIIRLFSFTGVALAGYFIGTDDFRLFAKSGVVSTFAYLIFLIFFLYNQKKGLSRYKSRIMMAVLVLPVLPLSYITVMIFSMGFDTFMQSQASLDYYAKLLLPALLIIKLLLNSIYLVHINRKVR